MHQATNPDSASPDDATPSPDLLRTLNGTALSPPPIWLMRQAGRYLPEYRALRQKAADFLTFCYTPELAVEATLQPIRRFDLDAAILFSDILVIPDALGAEVRFVEGTGPVLGEIRDAAGVAALGEAAAIEAHLAPVYEIVGELRRTLPGRVALIGFAGAPWTIASYMIQGRGSRDFATAKAFMWREPELFGRLMQRLEEAIALHLIRQIGAGADCVMLFDSWAGVLPAPEFRQWVIGPTRRIVQQVAAAAPEARVIGFPRQAGYLYADYFRDTGVAALAVDPGVPLSQLQALQTIGPVQGNLDPLLLAQGGPGMLDRARELVAGLKGGAYVFNLGHGVVPQTAPDHVAALVEAVREAGAA